MAINTFNDFSTTAASNIDIAGIGIQGTNNVQNFDNAFRTIMAIMRRDLDNGVVYASKTSSYTALETDNNAIHAYTATSLTAVLSPAATLGSGWTYTVTAVGFDVTIDPNGSELIDGQTTLIVHAGSSARIVCTGTAFYTASKNVGWNTIQRQVITSSVASVNFVSIPVGYDAIRLRGEDVAVTTDTDAVKVRMGVGSYDASSNYSWAYTGNRSDGTDIKANSASDTAIIVLNAVGNVAGVEGGGFEIILPKFSTSRNARLVARFSSSWLDSGTLLRTISGGGSYASNSGLNQIQALCTTGNIAAGTFILEGLIY